jgi:hypothetical protein
MTTQRQAMCMDTEPSSEKVPILGTLLGAPGYNCELTPCGVVRVVVLVLRGGCLWQEMLPVQRQLRCVHAICGLKPLLSFRYCGLHHRQVCLATLHNLAWVLQLVHCLQLDRAASDLTMCRKELMFKNEHGRFNLQSTWSIDKQLVVQ